MEELLEKLSNQELIIEIRELWHEFEGRETVEAKFAQACDKAEAVIQHNNADISSFPQGDYDINPYYKDHLFDFDSVFRELKDQIDIDSMEKIEKEGDINRVSQEHRDRWAKQNSL